MLQQKYSLLRQQPVSAVGHIRRLRNPAEKAQGFTLMVGVSQDPNGPSCWRLTTTERVREACWPLLWACAVADKRLLPVRLQSENDTVCLQWLVDRASFISSTPVFRLHICCIHTCWLLGSARWQTLCSKSLATDLVY